MLHQKLNEKYWNRPYESPRTHNFKEQPILSERRIALYGLILSLVVIFTKVIMTYREDIQKGILEQRLISYRVFSEDGNEMLMYTWKTAAKYSNIWLPALCGVLSSYFTWIMVYLDSDVPGIQPPSPLSPKKYKVQSGHTFHLNYMFAVLVGILVFFYMYFKGTSIQY